jgi:hypothetical protein
MGEKIIKFRKLSITEAERERTKNFDGDDFTIRIPLPLDKTVIIARVARAIGGQDINSMKPEDYDYIKMVITLNAVIVKNPDWWEDASKCPSDELLWNIYQFYQDSEIEFQENLKKNNLAANMEK